MGLAYCLIFSAEIQVFAQHEPSVIGSISNSLAQINTSQKGAWSAYNQTTEMVTDTAWQFGCYFGNPYLLSNYRTYGISMIHAQKNMAFGACLIQSGYSVYNQLSSVFAVALKLSTKLNLGTAIHVTQTRIKGLETKHHPNIVLDAKLYVTAKNTCYIRLFNPIINTKEYGYLANYIATLQHKITNKTNLYLQADIASENSGSVKTGISHFVNDKFQLRMGVGTKPHVISFGFGMRLNQTCFHFASFYHASLGFTPSCSAEFVKP